MRLPGKDSKNRIAGQACQDWTAWTGQDSQDKKKEYRQRDIFTGRRFYTKNANFFCVRYTDETFSFTRIDNGARQILNKPRQRLNLIRISVKLYYFCPPQSRWTVPLYFPRQLSSYVLQKQSHSRIGVVPRAGLLHSSTQTENCV